MATETLIFLTDVCEDLGAVRTHSTAEQHSDFVSLYSEELTEKYKSKLSSEMNGPIHEVMSRLVKAVTGRKITIPGTFKRYLRQIDRIYC